jgi:AhpD family alkylhydroperoxidase
MDYNAASPEGMKALGRAHGYVMQSGLKKSLIHLVFLRVSQINGCAFCIGLHSGDLLKGGMAIEKLVLVPSWREAGGLFDESERAALAWAESVTRVADTNVPESDFAAAAAVFNEKQLTDLTLAIAVMNSYNRMAISFRLPPTAATEQSSRLEQAS